MTKQRITVTIDEELVAAGNEAVAKGSAHSLSAWVNAAIAAKVEHESGLAALSELIADYEAEHGVITQEAIEERKRLNKEASEKVWARIDRRMGRK